MERVVLAARIRPPLNRETARKDFYKSAFIADDRTVVLEEVLPGSDPVIMARHSFVFDQAFDVDSTEDDVFNSIGRIPVATFLAGGNACIIAYGQTGTGKSHTLSSLIPRALSAIFARISTASVSYVEIYNETVLDLLSATQKNLKIARNPENNALTIESLTSASVESVEATLAVFAQGNSLRCTSATLMNHQSSRSHAIFTLKVSDTQKFYFVDLAGSERLQSSAETRNINRSLSALGHVIAALTEKNTNRIHVPFRDSKLTRILEDCLAPSAVCKTVLLVTVSPSNEAYGESLSTLKFAQRAQSLRTLKPPNSPTRARTEDSGSAEIRRLEKELAVERSLRIKLEEKLAIALKRPPTDTKTIETLLAKQRDALNSFFAAEPPRTVATDENFNAPTYDSPLARRRGLEAVEPRAVESLVKTGNSVEALIARRRKQLESNKNSNLF